ncbi:MAG: rod shape-determining protein [Actinomycetota bacterium]|nr:rod shape-determining protein [Actinomycetota bacterium]
MAFLNGGGGGRDLAIDLGTANTLVYERGRGIVLSEPSVVAIDSDTGAVHAVGDEAKRMIGRTPASISAIRPLRHGVIADFEVTERMLHYFMRRAGSRRLGRSRVVMCVPSSVTEVEKRAVEEACVVAGARQVHLIEEPIAAAIGAGLPIAEPSGSMIVDVGGGTSEVAVLSLGAIVVSESLRIGGYDFDDAITVHMKRRHGMAIGQRTSEDMKHELGSAVELDPELSGAVRGRDLVSGLPRTVTISSEELREAYAEQLQAIVDTVHATLERTPPELASDLAERGIVLAGGGTLLKGFDVLLADETQLPVRLADSPLTCVAVGAGQSLEEFGTLERMGGRRARTLGRTRGTSFAR